MEVNKENKTLGVEVFKEFIKNSSDENPHFDYFILLDHLSQNKLDKDLIAAIFRESNFLDNFRKQSH